MGHMFNVQWYMEVKHGNIWAVNAEQEAKLERTEIRMVRWMCGVSLREKKTNAELRESMGIKKISDVMRCSSLRWMGMC